MPTARDPRIDHAAYVRACVALARLSSRSSRHPGTERTARIKEDLGLAGIALSPAVVLSASRGVSTLCVVAGIVLMAAGVFNGPSSLVASGILLCTIVAYVAGEAVRAYPSSVASRRASAVLKSATGTASVMLMCLRHEPSIPRAIRIGAARPGEFASELRSALWGVIMSRYDSFEQALHSVGDMWSRHSSELKTALNAMVTASREATEAGRRRALDRANQAIVAGARMRIEQYALSLSTPSMVMFGIGILLPLMVGSLLPMLSWDMWSLDAAVEGDLGDGLRASTVQTVLLMNVVFPAIAGAIAHDAVSRHPFGTAERAPGSIAWLLLASAGIGAAGLAVSWALSSHLQLDQWLTPPLMVTSACFPAAALLVTLGGRLPSSDSSASRKEAEDLLFRMGAKMVDGENFESAMRRSGAGLGRRLCHRSALGNMSFEEALAEEPSSSEGAHEALRVVREAAAKDEVAAGTLAMDLTAYLKELSDLESTMRNRLRPTISMMRLTAHAMAPLVLGITCVIFDSLASIASGPAASYGAAWLTVVLGVFLAEMNAIVVYFVWGISEGRDTGALARSIGSCVVVSEFVFLATATAL